uniref:Uncharacterized protein n=1 Tax=Oryza brachyantha TaxID=4533 RepID=J3MK14_ORYBR
MLQVQGSLRIHTFSSAAVVHAVESSDEDTNPPHFSAVPRNGKKASREEIRKKVKRLVSSLRQKHHISKAANNEAIEGRGGGGQSDVETFVSAKSSELCSFRTDDGSEPPSFRLSPPPPIFPAGCVEGQHPASPVKIIKKLPFGYVIGRRLDAPAAAVPSTKLSLNLKNLMPRLIDLQLKSRSKMIRKKVVRALKERFRGGGGRQGRDEHAGEDKESINDGDGDDDEDVFWRKDVRGLRCRRVQDSDLPY